MARSATRTARADWSLSRRPFFKPSDQNYACSARLNIFPFAARLFDPHFGHSVEIMTLDPQRRFARVRSPAIPRPVPTPRSEEHTSELQSLMRTSYADFCLKKKKHQQRALS